MKGYRVTAVDDMSPGGNDNKSMRYLVIDILDVSGSGKMKTFFVPIYLSMISRKSLAICIERYMFTCRMSYILGAITFQLNYHHVDLTPINIVKLLNGKQFMSFHNLVKHEEIRYSPKNAIDLIDISHIDIHSLISDICNQLCPEIMYTHNNYLA